MKYLLSILTLTILLTTGCSKDDDYQVGKGLDLKNILAFTTSSQPLVAADNKSTYLVTVQLSPLADSLLRDVVFTVAGSSGATFGNNDTIQTVTANSNSVAQVRLSSGSIGPVLVQATVQQHYTIDTTFTFTRSYPEDMLLSADKYVDDTTASFTFTTELFRDPGKGSVSDPTKVYFNMTSPDTSLHLMMPAFAYSDSQKVIITATNPFHVSGRFEVEAWTLKSETDTLKRKILIEVKK